nr:uncharacterized protein LOC107446052 [Parasteatoda tepidariorum]
MFWFYFFLALSSCAVIRCEDEGNDQGTVIGEEMIKAIQDKMDKLDFLVKILKTLFNFSLEPEQEAARSDNCLPPGSECNAFSGPNCCGVRTRCYIFDTQVATRRGPAKWISRCKDYPLGVLLDNISG